MLLWKYVGKTPSDFDELDRRFFHRGLYLEGLMTESLEVSVCIDTSGSVSNDLINQFMSELRGIIQSYPHVKVKFFSCDCELAGPFDLSQVDEIPKFMEEEALVLFHFLSILRSIKIKIQHPNESQST